MSYGNKYEYMIVPTDTFKIIRGCAGCGSKQIFTCKGRFRVNSNGNLLDVWLIYGCEKCEHTYNLPIYERLRAEKYQNQNTKVFWKMIRMRFSDMVRTSRYLRQTKQKQIGIRLNIRWLRWRKMKHKLKICR